MINKEAARQRTQMLKALRAQHEETVARTQELLKKQKALRRQLCGEIRSQPKTVPEIAEAIGLPADQVLWHLTAMKKYDLVAETGMCGEYYLYQLTKDGGS